MKYTELPHFSHPDHNLKLVHYDAPYKCDGCKEIGFGLRYRCDPCNYDLHKDCMFTTSTSSHAFYKQCTFEFYDCLPGGCERYCDACGRDVKGFVYHCKKHGRDLHPCCRNLPCKIEGEGLKLSLREKVSRKCFWCGRRELWKGVTGWSYVSNCKNFHFHVSCVKEMLVQNWELGHFFQGGDDEQKNSTTNNKALSLERNKQNMQLEAVDACSRHGEKIRKYWGIVKLVVKIIVSTLLGDPTAGVVWLIEYLVSS